MIKIFPKTNELLEGVEFYKEYISKYKGIEIQYFEDKNNLFNYEIKDSINKVCDIYPELEEIVIHPPLSNHDIELLLMKDTKLFFDRLKELVELSKKYNKKIDIIYHTRWTFEYHKRATIEVLKEALKIIEGTEVKILLENIYMMEENICSVLEICNYLDHPNLRVCIDTCHYYCQAHIYKARNEEEYIKKYLNKEYAKKYVYQVHFSDTKNNDGYIDRKTHGVAHDDVESVEKDIKLLEECGIVDYNLVTEVSEQDYINRPDQIREIEMIKKILENKN